MLLGLYIAVPILRCITANEQVMRYFLVFAFVMNFVVPLATGAGTIPATQEFFSAFMIQLPLGLSLIHIFHPNAHAHRASHRSDDRLHEFHPNQREPHLRGYRP